jgi:pimeloyl-ACP methyl ester carboxylesterase
MTTFALVHGGWHGAWCWDLLTPLLERGGHRVVTMDLPCDDPSADFEVYADVVCAALTGCDGDINLVGHSLGGNTIPLVAARRPVSHLVYLCAVLPRTGSSLMDQVADDPGMLNPGYLPALSEPDDRNRQVWVDPALARRHLYADCDDATATAAILRLRPQALHPMLQPYPLRELPAVDSTYVVCTDDLMVPSEWSRRVAPGRVGADLIELPGSHSPFLSRPRALAEVLLDVAGAVETTVVGAKSPQTLRRP